MTTETRQEARRLGLSILVRSSAGALAAGLVVALLGLLVDGRSGLLAAVLGTLVVVGVLFTGALVVTIVADVLPSASLLVALMTYTLQMVLLAVSLVPLRNTRWAEENLTAGWLAAAVIAGALVWTLAQVLLATRARIPVYDLPAAAEGGAR